MRNVRHPPLKGIFLRMPLRSIDGVVIGCRELHKELTDVEFHVLNKRDSASETNVPSIVEMNSIFSSQLVERTL